MIWSKHGKGNRVQIFRVMVRNEYGGIILKQNVADQLLVMNVEQTNDHLWICVGPEYGCVLIMGVYWE